MLPSQNELSSLIFVLIILVNGTISIYSTPFDVFFTVKSFSYAETALRDEPDSYGVW